MGNTMCSIMKTRRRLSVRASLRRNTLTQTFGNKNGSGLSHVEGIEGAQHGNMHKSLAAFANLKPKPFLLATQHQHRRKLERGFKRADAAFRKRGTVDMKTGIKGGIERTGKVCNTAHGQPLQRTSRGSARTRAKKGRVVFRHNKPGSSKSIQRSCNRAKISGILNLIGSNDKRQGRIRRLAEKLPEIRERCGKEPCHNPLMTHCPIGMLTGKKPVEIRAIAQAEADSGCTAYIKNASRITMNTPAHKNHVDPCGVILQHFQDRLDATQQNRLVLLLPCLIACPFFVQHHFGDMCHHESCFRSATHPIRESSRLVKNDRLFLALRIYFNEESKKHWMRLSSLCVSVSSPSNHPEVQILYPVAMQMSMMSHARCGSIFWLRLCLVMLAVPLLLAGCGTRRADSPEPPTFHSVEREKQFTLPPDDGKPLSPAEKAAFLSVGDFDANLSMAERSEVLRHFKKLVHRERGTVRESVARARRYMPYICKILEERNLPRELAYLPFIESNYNVLVRSRSGALGMWQFMPSTARYYGMSLNHWIDERRDPYISTRAAATYFERLRDFFDGDWHLAISAYNAGEGKIRRGLDATGADTFFELRARDSRIQNPKLKMTSENKQYLPKFLAVCKIMRNLKLLGFESIESRPSPDMISVAIPSGTHLPSLASVCGTSWDEFQKYNAIYLRMYSPPGRHVAWVPLSRQNQSIAWLKKQQSSCSYASWRPYTTTSQDTLWRIAKRHCVPQTELCRVNGLTNRSFRAGMTLLVPPRTASNSRPAAPARSQQTRTASRNNADRRAHLLAQRLIAQDVSSVGNRNRAANQKNKDRPARRAGESRTYRVQKGDTIWSIARKHNLSPKQLLAANGMKIETAHLHPGDTVRLR